MHLLDWLLVLVPLLIVFGLGLYTQRYMKSVRDFTSSGRVAGPYLLAVAKGEVQAGAVVFVALFEIVGNSGFTFVTWWNNLTYPVLLFVAVSGFVYYRYRETRAMTLAQFFELRYSKSFRLFTGLLAFAAGIVNFGIIPAIGSRFMVYFLGLPPELTIFSIALPTYIPLMALLLSISLTITLSGGLISVMVADCVGGILSELIYIVIIVALLAMFSWPQITTVLVDQPPGQSLTNPFDSLGLKDFNIWYVGMFLFMTVYGTMAQQYTSGSNSAAISPHASVMGNILGRWRENGKWALIALLAISAMTFLKHPDFATQAAEAHRQIGEITNPQIQQQMRIPIAASHLLPIGIKGLFCVVLLMGIFGGDATHLHSWGSIFVQDVLVPLRKKPFEPRQHIRILRLAVVGVAVFALLFGSLFRQTQYIIMWFMVTGAIYVGGAGACIIGGLYWKKGNATGAWAALLTGSGLAVSGIAAQQIFGKSFPLNGIQVSFCAALIAIAVYATVSLLTHKEDFDMDRMLHHGKYAKPEAGKPTQEAAPKKPFWIRLSGIDEHFTRSEKWIAGGLFVWSMAWCFVFLVGTAWNVISPWPDSAWLTYCHVAGIGIPIVYSAATAIWFAWGGSRDIRLLFLKLRAQKINHLDNGTVVNHQNLDESVSTPDAAVPAGKASSPARAM